MSIHNQIPVQTEFVLRKSNKRIKPLKRHRNKKDIETVVYPVLSPIAPDQRNEKHRVKKVSKSRLQENKKRKPIKQEIKDTPTNEQEIVSMKEIDNNEQVLSTESTVEEVVYPVEKEEKVVAQPEQNILIEKSEEKEDVYSEEKVRVYEAVNKQAIPWLGTTVNQRNL